MLNHGSLETFLPSASMVEHSLKIYINYLSLKTLTAHQWSEELPYIEPQHFCLVSRVNRSHAARLFPMMSTFTYNPFACLSQNLHEMLKACVSRETPFLSLACSHKGLRYPEELGSSAPVSMTEAAAASGR